MEAFEFISQVMILITGVFALGYLSSQDPRDRMIGGIIGLAGEPFWAFTLYNHEQMVVLGLAVIYAFNFCRIIRSNHLEMKRYGRLR